MGPARLSPPEPPHRGPKRKERPVSETYDYIIVGAGSAGCVLAARLSEDPHCRVLLLEAGGEDRHPLLRTPLGFAAVMNDPRFGWGYTSEPEPGLGGRTLPLPRGRVLGGSSSINAMMWLRGQPYDYDHWAAAGCTGWSYREVLPYFLRAEDFAGDPSPWRGRGGPMPTRPVDTTHLLHEALASATAAAGLARSDDLDGPRSEGFGRAGVNIDARGRRASTARTYLAAARGRPNFRHRTGAMVTRLTFEGLRATGVELRLEGQVEHLRAGREVLLCGGTYNSAQLLMLSGIGPPGLIEAVGLKTRHALEGVGRNLQEHPTVMVEYRAREPVTFLNQIRLDRAVRHALQWAVRGRGPFATQLNSGVALVRTRPGLPAPDIQIAFQPIALDALPWVPGLGPAPVHRFWAGVMLLRPRSRGTVTLRSADPLAPPRVSLNLYDDPEDLATLRRGIARTREIYRSGAQAPLTGDELQPGDHVRSDDALNDFIASTTYLSQHPVGTCAMGVGARAVVDPSLRVHGLPGLRVVDASVMPTVPGANTNATTVMIAEKGADLILGRAPATAAVAAAPGPRKACEPMR